MIICGVYAVNPIKTNALYLTTYSSTHNPPPRRSLIIYYVQNLNNA